jgi:short subunit dehydrogenase-like uncharacterized protein
MAAKQTGSEQKMADIVLWGATSFVGQLLVEYLWPRYGATDEIRMAIGGRSRSRLEAVHRRVNADDRLGLLVGDASDETFLETMARNARVVVSTVGPYARYGSPLVAACASAGTDYCDLTGEPQWIRRMIDAHQETAAASGARIIHTCGFDSIPSDLGVLFLQEEAQKRFGQALSQVKLRVAAIRGGLSGGTVASILNVAEEMRRDPEVVKWAKNPFSLAPEGMRRGVRQPNVSGPTYDRDLNRWVGPFIMAAVNTKVVHRSNALLGYPWGDAFQYDEAMVMGKGMKGALQAAAFSGGLGAFFMGALFAPTRFIMKKTFLPKPGEGPSQKERETGFFKLHLIGKDQSGNALRAEVAGDRDPGYGATSKMLGESAVCLLRDRRESDLAGGFWTPASGMGRALIDRLTVHAGLTFGILENR